MLIKFFASLSLLLCGLLLLCFNLWMQSGRGWLGFNLLCLIVFEAWVWNKGSSRYINIGVISSILLYLALGTVFMLSSTVDFRSRFIVIVLGLSSCLLCILAFGKKLFH